MAETTSTTADASAGSGWGWLLAGGIIAILLGTAAIIVPFAVSVGVTIFLGAFLLADGIVEIIRAFRHTGLKGWWWWGLMGLLYAILGIILLADPLKGVLTLTLVLAILFIIKGVAAVVQAFAVRPLPGWVWLLLSGIATIVLGALIGAGWPGTAWAIGLLVGIEMIMWGWSLVMLSFAAKAEAG